MVKIQVLQSSALVPAIKVEKEFFFFFLFGGVGWWVMERIGKIERN